jgi:hypothetical protein
MYTLAKNVFEKCLYSYIRFEVFTAVAILILITRLGHNVVMIVIVSVSEEPADSDCWVHGYETTCTACSP